MYALDLLAETEGLFEINSTSGVVTVGSDGPTRLVIRNQMPTSFQFDVFAYYLSSGLNGSRV